MSTLAHSASPTGGLTSRSPPGASDGTTDLAGTTCCCVPTGCRQTRTGPGTTACSGTWVPELHALGWLVVAARGTPATVMLDRLGIPHTMHHYQHDPRHGSYGLEASDALGVEPGRVFKTLIADVDGTLTAGGKRAAMAAVTAAERATGYVAGGISPLGQRRRLPVVVDAAALEFGTIFCSGGRRGLDIELGPTDLVRAANASVAATSRPAAGQA